MIIYKRPVPQDDQQQQQQQQQGGEGRGGGGGEGEEGEGEEFLAGSHMDQSNVVQEVLADLKIRKISGRLMSDAAPRSPSSPTRPEGQGGCAHHTATTTTLCPIYDLSRRSILY